MRKIILFGMLALSGCTFGYWPKVEGDMGAKYQADVRECQTGTQVGLATGARQGTAAFALDALFVGERAGSPAAVDACMEARGYRLAAQ